MKKLSSVLIIVFIVGTIFGQIITVSESEVTLGRVNINTESSVNLTITNNADEEVLVNVIENSAVISFEQSSFNIPSNQNYTVTLSFIPETNVTYNHTVFFNVEDSEFSVPVKVIASGKFPDSLYNGTDDKWDSELRTAMSQIIANHHSISYEDARVQLFGYIANVNGRVRCVYTNEWYNCSYGNTPNWNDINTEHTWPQSMGAAGTAKSDLHHLFPTNSQANSIRGNYPFGEVVNTSWQNGGSKKGTNSSGNTVFEPRDDHKGDTARVMFYFALRYGNLNNFLNSANQQLVMKNWYYADPVSQYEIERNEEIEAIQNKPNPFIEYPQLMDRIANMTDNSATPRSPLICTPYAEYNFPGTALNQTSQLSIPIANGGNKSLTISSIQFTDPAFTISDFPASLEIGDWGVVTVNFTPSLESEYSCAMNIYSNTDVYQLSLIGNGGTVSNDNHDAEVFSNVSLTNYPNPFAAQTTLSFRGVKQQSAAITIYNLKGQKVTTIANHNLRGGIGEVAWDGTDSRGKKLPSGLYFAKLSAGNQSTTRKILIMK